MTLAEAASTTDALLAQLIMAHGAAITRYCYSILCDYHDAQDAAQMAFIKAHKKAAQLRDEDAAGPWLYRIAYHTCLDIRRNRRLYALFVGGLPKEDSVYEDAPDLGLREELIRALRILSPKERALFYSRAVEDLDFNALAERFGASAQTLRKRYERARKKLARELEKIRSGVYE
ncbi:MAG: sigma-70 family RNA polymerase sigma factor [Defluviitaleaceae bacterium]|nr:sigma-70 family RNA polymerase sigma factor [Defluviitaleaceae bacterium]MCL2275070.1 sigma-70 family RNA polymerase sigma factor [Defluviitaleaceae bacterium]